MIAPPTPVVPNLQIPADLAARPDLGPSAKLAFMAVWAAIGMDGLCRLPLAELQARVGLSDKTMRNALAELVEAGLLTPIPCHGRPTLWAATPVKSTGVPPSTPVEMTGVPDTPPRSILPDPLPQGPDIWPDLETTPVKLTDPARARVTDSLLIEENSIPLAETVRKGVRGKPAAPRRMPVPCPADFTPTPRTLALLAHKRPDVDLSHELAKFTRYWTEGRGAGTRRPDWNASFIGWVEKADGTPPGAAAAPGGARADGAAGRLSPTSQRLLEIAMGDKIR